MKPHKHCELIKAWADGAEIQKFCDDGWYDDSDTPEWYEDCEYRIKPRIVTKTGWVNIHKELITSVLKYAIIYRSEAEAFEQAGINCIATVKVEWTEEVE